MAVDKIKHTKPASQRTFLDELEPIPYTISDEEIAAMDPRMQEVLFGIKPVEKEDKPYTPPPIPQEVEEPEAEEVVAAPEPKADEVEKEERFDYLSLGQFGEAEKPHITLIFPAEEGEKELLEIVRSIEANRTQEVEGRLWHAVRFNRHDVEKLKRVNEFLGNRPDVYTLVNGKRTPYARTMDLVMMYIFSAGKYV